MLGRLAELVDNPKFVIFLLFIVVIGLIAILLVVITMGPSQTSFDITLIATDGGSITGTTVTNQDPDTVTMTVPDLIE